MDDIANVPGDGPDETTDGRDRDAAEPTGDDDAVDEVADALPGSGRLGVSDDDLDGSSGPIQVP